MRRRRAAAGIAARLFRLMKRLGGTLTMRVAWGGAYGDRIGLLWCFTMSRELIRPHTLLAESKRELSHDPFSGRVRFVSRLGSFS